MDGESGVLLDDPGDLASFGATRCAALLADPERARRDRARRPGSASASSFLGTRHLIQYLDLLDGLIAGRGAGEDG